MHAGHVRYLQAARRLAPSETLSVAVAPDTYIQFVKKRQPYWSQTDRLQTVFALGCVDSVIAQASDSVAQVIRDYRPRLFVKGPDWRGQLPDDVLAACQEVGTEIQFVNTSGRHVRDARK